MPLTVIIITNTISILLTGIIAMILKIDINPVSAILTVLVTNILIFVSLMVTNRMLVTFIEESEDIVCWEDEDDENIVKLINKRSE